MRKLYFVKQSWHFFQNFLIYILRTEAKASLNKKNTNVFYITQISLYKSEVERQL